MSHEFRICDKCKGTNEKTLIPKLKELDDNAHIIVGCQNFCGIGRTKPFVIVDHIPVVAPTEDELIENIKKQLSKDKN